jgi:preprotein translocase subunit YajC
MNGLTWDPDKTKEHGEYPNWRTDPIVQQRLAKHWPYGYPTFYGANVFAHHKNHDPALGFGDVMMAYWNDRMKRVELVMRINNKQAAEKGHSTFIERLHTGKRVDLSMGCFAAGAMITMADGTRKPIEKIRVGDRVITHTGATSTVTETHRRKYTGTLFTVRPANEDAFVTTVEHPFWAAPVKHCYTKLQCKVACVVTRICYTACMRSEHEANRLLSQGVQELRAKVGVHFIQPAPKRVVKRRNIVYTVIQFFKR